MRALLVLAALTFAAPASADNGTGITATTSFMLGSFQIGDAHGLQAPGGHFDVGFRVRRWRLAAELDRGLWSESRADHAGAFTRLGMGLQWAWKELERPGREHRPDVRFRGFVEVGLGRQHVTTPLVDISRDDVMIGLGVSTDMAFGKALFGAVFGVRMLISREPQTTVARGMSSPDRSLDLALLYVFGLRFGH